MWLGRRKGGRIGWGRLLGYIHLADTPLKLSNRKTTADGCGGQGLATIGLEHPKKYLGVALGQDALSNGILRKRVEIGQAKQIGDRHPIQSEPLSKLLVGQSELLDQSPDRLGSFDWVEILPLDVFDERPLGGRLIPNLADNGWYLGQPQKLGCSPASFASDQLESG